jgi:hypothetical protein
MTTVDLDELFVQPMDEEEIRKWLLTYPKGTLDHRLFARTLLKHLNWAEMDTLRAEKQGWIFSPIERRNRMGMWLKTIISLWPALT